MKEAVGFAAGIITSLLLETVPWIRKNWSRNQFKTLTLLIIHVGVGAAIWAAACLLHFNFPFAVPCGYQGLAQLGWTGTVAFASSQVTYQALTKRLPNAEARRLSDEEKLALQLASGQPATSFQPHETYTLSKLHRKGLVRIDPSTRTVTLTERGRKVVKYV